MKGLSGKIDARQQNGTTVSVINGQWCMSRADLAKHLLHPCACHDNTFYDLTMQLREQNDEQNSRQQ